MSVLVSQSDDRWIPVARLLRPQGRRGEILAEPLTDLHSIFAPGRELRIAAGPEAVSAAPSLTVQDSWEPHGRNAGRLVLKLGGIDSISAAESLEAKTLYLPESGLPALDEDTYLVGDLVGCSLYDGDALVGEVVDLQFPIGPDGRTRVADAADLLVVRLANANPDADPVLIPFIKAWLHRVDLTAKRIDMSLPPGLTEAADEPSEAEAEEEPEAEQG